MEYCVNFAYEGKKYEAAVKLARSEGLSIVAAKFHDRNLIERFGEEIVIYTDSKKVITRRASDSELFYLKTAIFDAIKRLPGITGMFGNLYAFSAN